jgi:hypothetical protein
MRKRERFTNLENHVSVEEVEGRKFVIVKILLTHLNFLVIPVSALDLSFQEISIWGPYLNMAYFAIRRLLI